ncbi:MAG: hypothetical protein WAR57_12835 [Candidatus Phosphoribacter sp.]
MTGPRDRRSVGELLLDSELTARSILWDVQERDAAVMLRTWGEVVQAAADLWHAIPSPAPNLPGAAQPPTSDDDLTMTRLHTMSTALHRAIRGRPWPGAGPADPQLGRIGVNLTRATDLVTRRQPHPTDPVDARARADVRAARARLIHTLYVGAHGLTLVLGRHVRELTALAQVHNTLPHGQSLPTARQAHTRLVAFEQLAGSYVARTYPHATNGEHRDPPVPGRLAQALAGWDIQSHRTLAARPRPADLLEVTRTQATITEFARAILYAGTVTGALDEHAYHSRLQPALHHAWQAWARTADLWARLTPPSDRRTDPDLLRAGGEAQAALLQLAHDGTGLATPHVIAARTDLAAAAVTLQQGFATGVDLAYLVRDVAAAGTLQVAARAANTVALTATTAAGHAIDTSPVDAWVHPQHLTSNTPIPAPPPVRDTLRQAGDDILAAATTLHSAGAALDRRTPPAGTTQATNEKFSRPLAPSPPDPQPAASNRTPHPAR